MDVWFFTSGRDYTLIGRLWIYFSSTPLYYIDNCKSPYNNFLVSLPTEVEKVWRITLNRNSGIRLLIHCNNVEVLNILMSTDTCSYSSWSTYWSRTVGKIWFHTGDDTASDFYRAGKSGRTVCNHNMTISSHFMGKLNYRRATQIICR